MPLTKPLLFSVHCFIGLFAVLSAASQPAVKTTVATTVMMPADSSKFTDSTRTDAFMEDLLKQYPPYFDSILNHRKAYNVQVIYTKVDRGANGIAALKNYYFNVNATHYFYPAEAVQLPISILTLQKLNELKANGIDKNTTMLTGKACSGQTAVYNDPTTTDGKPTIANYLKKVLLAGEQEAGDRLYEFLGQQYLNSQLQLKGYPNAMLVHRLSSFLTPDENRHTNPIRFLAPGNKLLYEQPMQFNTNSYPLRNDSLGKAYYSNGKLYNTPLSFSLKNRLCLEDLHTILVSLVFPNKVTASQRFAITDEDRKYLLKYMSQLPTETIHPPYRDDTATYYPAYSKYLLYGAAPGALPAGIRIFNRSGQGYGQLIDVAYIVDFDKKIEFFLSAVIDCNIDAVIKDDRDEYDSIGFPFMKHLGEVIYEYETKREKKILPDLGELKFEYDGK